MHYRLLTKIPGDAFGIKQLIKSVKDIMQYVEKKVQSHKNSFDSNNIRDYIDCFIVEAKRKNQNEPDSAHFFQGNFRSC